jgi:sphingomyelin phosphodiesterase
LLANPAASKEAPPSLGSLGCGVCKALRYGLVSVVDYGIMNFDDYKDDLCKIVSLASTLSEEGCVQLANIYKPIVWTNFLRMIVTKEDLICGLLLKVCDSPDIQFFDTKAYVNRILEDKPEKNSRPKASSKGTYSVLQVNDIHIDKDYVAGSVSNCDNGIICCRADSKHAPLHKKIPAGKFGTSASCDLPEQTFLDFLKFAKETVTPDYVMWLGDNEDHELDRTSRQGNVNATEYLADKMKAAFEGVPFWISIGNHESFPVDNYDHLSNRDAWFFQNMSQSFSGLITQAAEADMLKHGYYAQRIPERNLKIVSLLGASYDSLNFFNFARDFDPLGQLKWLEQELARSEALNEDVIIVSHIPVGGDFTIAQWNDVHNALIERYQNSIAAVFAAHTHLDHFKFYEAQGAAERLTAVNLIAPSLTTMHDLHPSFRVYHIDVETNQVVDYDQYRLDLDKWNKSPEGTHAQWDKVYSFLEHYGLPDMSLASLKQLQSTIYQKSPAFMEKFWANMQSSFEKKTISNETMDLIVCDSKAHSRQKKECLKQRGIKPNSVLEASTALDYFLKYN